MFDLNLSQLLPPLPEHTDLVSTTIKINGSEIPSQFSVYSIKVNRCMYKIPYAMIVLLDGDVAEQQFETSDSTLLSPGNEIEILAGYRQDEEQIFKGIIIKHSVKIRQGRPAVLEIECKDEAVKMTVGRKNKYYFNEKDSDIIDGITRSYGIDSDIADTNVQHPEMVQYHATDWDFIMNRAEANGLLVAVKDGTLSIQPPDWEQQAKFTLTYGTSIVEFEAAMDARDQYPAVKASTWSHADQELSEVEATASGVSSLGGLGSALGAVAGAVGAATATLGIDLPGVAPDTDFTDVLGLSHFGIQHAGAMAEEELQDWAASQFQKSKLAKLKGRVRFEGVADIYPGETLAVQGVGLRHDGTVFVTAVSHEISEGNWYTDAQFGLSQQWFVEEHPDVNDTLAASLLPAVHGLQIAVVTSLGGDPDGEDRIQVRMPLVQGDGEGVWARIACQDAGDGRGSFFRPEIGDEVIVGFVNDDPRFAVVLGMLNSSAHPAPLPTTDDNHEKGWITRSGMRTLFNDEKKSITIETPAGKTVTLDEDAGILELKDENNNSITMDSNGITIESGAKLVLKAQQDVELEGLNVSQKANANFKAEGQAQTELSSTAEVVIKGTFVRIN